MKHLLLLFVLISFSCKWDHEEVNLNNLRFEFTSTDTSYSVVYYKMGNMVNFKNIKIYTNSWAFDTVISGNQTIEFSGFPKDEGANTVTSKMFYNGKLIESKSCSSFIGANCNVNIKYTAIE